MLLDIRLRNLMPLILDYLGNAELWNLYCIHNHGMRSILADLVVVIVEPKCGYVLIRSEEWGPAYEIRQSGRRTVWKRDHEVRTSHQGYTHVLCTESNICITYSAKEIRNEGYLWQLKNEKIGQAIVCEYVRHTNEEIIYIRFKKQPNVLAICVFTSKDIYVYLSSSTTDSVFLGVIVDQERFCICNDDDNLSGTAKKWISRSQSVRFIAYKTNIITSVCKWLAKVVA